MQSANPSVSTRRLSLREVETSAPPKSTSDGLLGDAEAVTSGFKEVETSVPQKVVYDR